MQYVSVRNFQLHAKKFLLGLPLVLTRYNVPVAKIIKVSNSPQEKTTMSTAGIKNSKVPKIDVGAKSLSPASYLDFSKKGKK